MEELSTDSFVGGSTKSDPEWMDQSLPWEAGSRLACQDVFRLCAVWISIAVFENAETLPDLETYKQRSPCLKIRTDGIHIYV